MKQQYRTVCARRTELVKKKKLVLKSKTAAHSTTVTMPALFPFPVENKRQSQHSSRQLTHRPPSIGAPPLPGLRRPLSL